MSPTERKPLISGSWNDHQPERRPSHAAAAFGDAAIAEWE